MVFLVFNILPVLGVSVWFTNSGVYFQLRPGPFNTVCDLDFSVVHFVCVGGKRVFYK